MAVIFHASVFYWMISPAAMLVLMQRIWRYYHPPPLSTRRDPLPLLSHLRRPRVTNGQDASPRHERSLKASSPASPSGKLENERETTWPSDCPNVPRGVIGFILTDIGFVRKEWPQPLFFRALKLPRSRLCLVPRSPGISGPVSISHPPPFSLWTDDRGAGDLVWHWRLFLLTSGDSMSEDAMQRVVDHVIAVTKEWVLFFLSVLTCWSMENVDRYGSVDVVLVWFSAASSLFLIFFPETFGNFHFFF